MLLGKDHQKRYLSILNREMHDVKQNAEINGIDRTIYKQDEISRMEMKYLIDVIDMRRYGTMPDQYYWAGKWSRKFTAYFSLYYRNFRTHIEKH